MWHLSVWKVAWWILLSPFASQQLSVKSQDPRLRHVPRKPPCPHPSWPQRIWYPGCPWSASPCQSFYQRTPPIRGSVTLYPQVRTSLQERRSALLYSPCSTLSEDRPLYQLPSVLTSGSRVSSSAGSDCPRIWENAPCSSPLRSSRRVLWTPAWTAERSCCQIHTSVYRATCQPCTCEMDVLLWVWCRLTALCALQSEHNSLMAVQYRRQ